MTRAVYPFACVCSVVLVTNCSAYGVAGDTLTWHGLAVNATVNFCVFRAVCVALSVQ